ncbi:hypothetical protein Scep_001622 [Stephania cephalantha]|uniref:Uncharacterized protein n=1 Tax=Stephania cephalantha TaxID=152367 RepID=A0AAP0L8J9_9MAGN
MALFCHLVSRQDGKETVTYNVGLQVKGGDRRRSNLRRWRLKFRHIFLVAD